MVDVDRGAGHLLARVIVNRLWQHHFGEGIVRTPNDFGAQGERPVNAALLDWLAEQLVAAGWRLKPLHKQIVMSAAYRQLVSSAGELADVDPEARFYFRRPRRLEAEALRDSILAVSDRLDLTMFGPPEHLFVRQTFGSDAVAAGVRHAAIDVELRPAVAIDRADPGFGPAQR
jgi:hypothetical protein